MCICNVSILTYNWYPTILYMFNFCTQQIESTGIIQTIATNIIVSDHVRES